MSFLKIIRNIRRRLTPISLPQQALLLTLVNWSSPMSSAALKAFLTSLPNIATITIIVMLATFFISKDWYGLIKRYKGIFSDMIVKTTKLIRTDLQKALFGYIRAQLILVSLTALVVIIGLLVLRVDYAITIGLLTGLS